MRLESLSRVAGGGSPGEGLPPRPTPAPPRPVTGCTTSRVLPKDLVDAVDRLMPEKTSPKKTQPSRPALEESYDEGAVRPA